MDERQKHMMNLLPILGVSAGDAIQAERLLDLLAIFNRKTPKGAILIAAAPDLHGETKAKLRIAAEIGFEHVDVLEVGWGAVAPTSKTEAVNNLVYSALSHAARCYQAPCLWFEPDSVPIRPHWLEELTLTYWHQPKRYLGSILSSNDGKVKCLSRVAIYPRGAGGELKEACAGKLPFEIAAGGIIVPRAGKSKLFQQTPFTSTTERSVIRPETVLLHSDKESVLLSALIDEYSKPQAITHIVDLPEGKNSPLESPANGEVAIIMGDENVNCEDPEPPDKRTKAWKEWKARRDAMAPA